MDREQVLLIAIVLLMIPWISFLVLMGVLIIAGL